MASGGSAAFHDHFRDLKLLGNDRLQTTAIYPNFTDVRIQEEFERKW